jgi:hypothetical protein
MENTMIFKQLQLFKTLKQFKTLKKFFVVPSNSTLHQSLNDGPSTSGPSAMNYCRFQQIYYVIVNWSINFKTVDFNCWYLPNTSVGKLYSWNDARKPLWISSVTNFKQWWNSEHKSCILSVTNQSWRKLQPISNELWQVSLN